MSVIDAAVGVVGDLELGVDRLHALDEMRHARLEKAPPVLRRDEHALLLADVVADPDHVHAHAHQRLGGGQVVAVGDLQDGVGQVGVLDEVDQQLLEARAAPRPSRRSSSR